MPKKSNTSKQEPKEKVEAPVTPPAPVKSVEADEPKEKCKPEEPHTEKCCRKRQMPDPTSKRSKKRRMQEMKAKQPSICLEFFRSGKCTRENCKYSHDIQKFLNERTDALDTVCPLYDYFGKCQSGLTCQWYKSHTTEDFKQMTKEKKMKVHPILPELNKQDPPNIHLLRKGEYLFDIPTTFETPSKKLMTMDNKLILPSLCTFGNLPFRKTAKRYGCDVTMSEMVMANALVEGNKSDWALIRKDPLEDNFGIQLCVGNPVECAKAISLLNGFDCNFYELNCACPIDLVCDTGMGARLLERPKKIAGLLAAARGVTERPVALKVRTGCDEITIAKNLVPFVEDYGCGMLSIHGRTRKQRYTKSADWDYIQTCCGLTQCPVVGVGDIYTYDDYTKAMSTGVKSVAIGRGALMKPWIFTEIKEKRNWDITSSERIEMLKQFAIDGLNHWGSDSKGVGTTREFMCHHLTFMSRYVPVHCLVDKQKEISIHSKFEEGMQYKDEMEELLASDKIENLVKITEMFLGPAPKDYVFVPKHNSYAKN
ncbi:tRNA-dihydrouridine synthase, putative [Entamoeba invadens IP1]|uniref:tRNA-dihydrouridine(47) synthase [NAD(P)(+)] n=1 Tax=Entamoeba invadens IP1 TaxID=370355 RepID=L7FJF5_ENTIV|nr:tRNA-dihydrouridine synthase, putative [Entamoeba invadens IP1]ELP83991.1 tRNA-dihydrouridine synthase, putative [Entamoeba invadens IP1]|eukprot:XP_004183337.1 tRNA-dihydrouridine synthase, putative [Entamoeba invadens IP1]